MSAGPWLVLHLADNGRWMTTALTGTVDLQQACEMERALARNGCRTLVVDVDSIAADFASRAQTWPQWIADTSGLQQPLGPADGTTARAIAVVHDGGSEWTGGG